MHSLDMLDGLLARGAPDAQIQKLCERIRSGPLADALELAAIAWHWRHTDGRDVCPPTNGARNELLGTLAMGRSGETCEIPARWAAGDEFTFFEERFKDALVRVGIPTRHAHALSGALSEMASNAHEHSLSPMTPVASFEVVAHRWSFSVTDVGCGMAESLRRNPTYSGIRDDGAALSLAVQDGVSGTGKTGRGHGFATLFRALVDRACTIRLRSTGATAAWEGVSPGAQTLNITLMPPRSGVHIVVSGSRNHPI